VSGSCSPDQRIDPHGLVWSSVCCPVQDLRLRATDLRQIIRDEEAVDDANDPAG